MITKKNKKRIWQGLAGLTALIVSIFFIALFSYFWDFIILNRFIILIITGLLILVLWIIGVFDPKRFQRSARRRLS